ncbi:hypothetical protein [Kaistella antarctica]|uniref:Uncharacterized protein n=1 Tax=Kaistella antarctica TaxID=266748 RepID=A0A3S4YTB9_9FLAO|nr:hypothetical protein [Kaistella antarctica]KEY18716.1 hypothetical protein HY04_09555 [Kaistella antarctica]SEW16280.1 hypothetical protein SAMN05421765_2822 [Kaistella antarctica]VEH99663.1 Uncharacterised protein [Kaistella antarctica]
MKKLILIFGILTFSLILTDCSRENESSNSAEIKINPPNWIQGTWLLENPNTNIGFRFTTNDVVIIQSGAELSQRGQLELFKNSGQSVSASNESSENIYKLISNFPGGQTTIYSFTKISNTKIKWDAVTNSVYTKQ